MNTAVTNNILFCAVLLSAMRHTSATNPGALRDAAVRSSKFK